MVVKTNFTPQDLEVILAQYNLGKFVDFKPFEEGQDQTNLLLITATNKVVLRYYEKRTIDYAAYEIELLYYLAKHAYPCAGPYQNQEGSYVGVYKGKPYAVFEYIEGKHTDDPEHYLQVTEMIGKLHLITQNYQPDVTANRPNYDPAYVWANAQDSAKKIPSANEADRRLSWMRAQLDTLELSEVLPRGVCHGDPNPTNFLYLEDRISGVLDFDQANYTWLLVDVAELIYWWTWPDKGELDITQTKRLIRAYERVRPLNEAERSHLFDALKLVLLLGMGWFMHHEHDYANHVRKMTLLDEMGRQKLARC